MLVWNEFINDARVLKEAESLQKNGYCVTVYALHTPGVTLKQEMLASGVQIKRILRSPLWIFRKSRNKKITNTLKGPINKIGLFKKIFHVLSRLWTHLCFVVCLVKSKADIIHAHDVNMLPTAWFAALLTRSLLIYDAHEISVDREGYSSFRSFVWYIEKLIFPYVDGAITTTDIRAKFFARAYKVPRPIVLRNCPNYTRAKKSSLIREELKLHQPWPIIVYQGGLQQGRGLEMLISVVSQIKNAYFVFIGGGRLKISLQNMIMSQHIEKRVHFIDTVSLKMLPIYTASADIGIQPIENTCLNHYSTDSNKLFEYIMAGLPVIAADFPEIAKIIEKHEVGETFRAGDPNAMIAAINKLLLDPKLCAYYSERAIHAAKKLNWEDEESKLLEMYNILAKKLAN